MNTITNNKEIRSEYLVKYIRNVQQANKGTAAQYEYRLSKFEEYVLTASEAQKQQKQQRYQHRCWNKSSSIDSLYYVSTTSVTLLALYVQNTSLPLLL
jgi:hypothetical protein